MLAFTKRSKLCGGRVDFSMALQVEKQTKYWQSILKRAVSVIKFIAERGLAFRGNDQIIGSPANGNYLGMVELLTEFNPFLTEHIKLNANTVSGHVCRPQFVKSSLTSWANKSRMKLFRGSRNRSIIQ